MTPTPTPGREDGGQGRGVRDEDGVVQRCAKYGTGPQAEAPAAAQPQHEDAPVADEDEPADVRRVPLRLGSVATGAVETLTSCPQPLAVTTFWGTMRTSPFAFGSACILTRVSNDCVMSAWNCSATDA